jgi:hypothetical protein
MKKIERMTERMRTKMKRKAGWTEEMKGKKGRMMRATRKMMMRRMKGAVSSLPQIYIH